MAKKDKDTTAKPKKAAKPAAPVDPAKTRDLIRLLNILALILAIAAFLLQLFAVLTHHWKWQVTGLSPLVSPSYHYSQPDIYNDSRLDQQYGLYSRDVKLYANNDEQVDAWASTRFPQPDEGEDALHQCLSQTSTLRGAFLTCSSRVVSPEQCHCRRYTYWSFVIFFEILALILLGIALLLTALLPTQYHSLLKLAAAACAIVALICLLLGLILILSYLKRETRSLADGYPHLYRRFGEKLASQQRTYQSTRTKQTLLHKALRRQAHETYRAYPLQPGQHPYNETHFQEYSEQTRGWVYRPYTSINIPPVPYPPLSQRGRQESTQPARRTSTQAPLQSAYGPAVSHDTVYDHTRAGIGWSTVLSILATILSLLLPLILLYSWMNDKKLGAPPKTTTTTTTTSTRTEYVPVPQEIPASGPPPARSIPTDYSHQRPIGEAVVTTHNVPPPSSSSSHETHHVRSEPVIVRDVIIRDEPQASSTTQEHSFPVNVESHQTAHNA